MIRSFVLSIAVVIIPLLVFASDGTTTIVGFQDSDWSTDGSTIYFGKNYGIYKSTNSGSSTTLWHTIPTGYNSTHPNGSITVLFIPKRASGETTDRMVVSALGTGKLYLCTDITQATPTFTEVLDISGLIGGLSTDRMGFINITEDNYGNLYVGTYAPATDPQTFAYLYKSTDRGANWTSIKHFTGSHIHNVAFNQHNDWLYCQVGEMSSTVTTDYNGPGSLGEYEDDMLDSWHLFRSTDYGTTWTKVTDRQTEVVSAAWLGHEIDGIIINTSVGFIDDEVFLGEDFPGFVQGYGSIRSFTDTGASQTFTMNEKFTDSTGSLRGIFYSIRKFGSKLIAIHESWLDYSSYARCLSSEDGETWTVEQNTSIIAAWNYTGYSTEHPSRGGKTFYALTPTTGYYLSGSVVGDDELEEEPPASSPSITGGYSGNASWH